MFLKYSRGRLRGPELPYSFRPKNIAILEFNFFSQIKRTLIAQSGYQLVGSTCSEPSVAASFHLNKKEKKQGCSPGGKNGPRAASLQCSRVASGALHPDASVCGKEICTAAHFGGA